ncbi:hypothetical protein B0O99DRAFT_597403 [Bisporella sp. PMI_857]|nr:hypothetical protein B0O99DRAFT_597403 [Bisporella sp. PMI_857]
MSSSSPETGEMGSHIEGRTFVDKLQGISLEEQVEEDPQPWRCLPVDIKLEIMENLPDISTLSNFLKVSASSFECFNRYRRTVLVSVLFNDLIESDVLVEALHLMLATRLQKIEFSGKEFLTGYEMKPIVTGKELIRRFNARGYKTSNMNQNGNPKFHPKTADGKGLADFSEQEIIDMLLFHQKAHCLTRIFSSSKLSQQATTGISSPTPVSQSESRRIHRAIYRYELFSRYFGKCRDFMYNGAQQLPRVRDIFLDMIHNDFLCGFESWELEELSCISDFLHDYYYEELMNCCMDIALDHPRSANSIITAELYFTTLGNANLWARQNAGLMISIGISTLHDFFCCTTTSSQAQMLFRMRNIKEAPQGLSLKQVLRDSAHDASHNLDIVARVSCTLNMQPSHFTFRGPNAAWHWSSQNITDRFVHSLSHRAALRRVGYVMWDIQRLHDWEYLREACEVFHPTNLASWVTTITGQRFRYQRGQESWSLKTIVKELLPVIRARALLTASSAFNKSTPPKPTPGVQSVICRTLLRLPIYYQVVWDTSPQNAIPSFCHSRRFMMKQSLALTLRNIPIHRGIKGTLLGADHRRKGSGGLSVGLLTKAPGFPAEVDLNDSIFGADHVG